MAYFKSIFLNFTTALQEQASVSRHKTIGDNMIFDPADLNPFFNHRPEIQHRLPEIISKCDQGISAGAPGQEIQNVMQAEIQTLRAFIQHADNMESSEKCCIATLNKAITRARELLAQRHSLAAILMYLTGNYHLAGEHLLNAYENGHLAALVSEFPLRLRQYLLGEVCLNLICDVRQAQQSSLNINDWAILLQDDPHGRTRLNFLGAYIDAFHAGLADAATKWEQFQKNYEQTIKHQPSGQEQFISPKMYLQALERLVNAYRLSHRPDLEYKILTKWYVEIQNNPAKDNHTTNRKNKIAQYVFRLALLSEIMDDPEGAAVLYHRLRQGLNASGASTADVEMAAGRARDRLYHTRALPPLGTEDIGMSNPGQRLRDIFSTHFEKFPGDRLYAVIKQDTLKIQFPISNDNIGIENICHHLKRAYAHQPGAFVSQTERIINLPHNAATHMIICRPDNEELRNAIAGLFFGFRFLPIHGELNIAYFYFYHLQPSLCFQDDAINQITLMYKRRDLSEIFPYISNAFSELVEAVIKSLETLGNRMDNDVNKSPESVTAHSTKKSIFDDLRAKRVQSKQTSTPPHKDDPEVETY